jgi:Beta protein
MDNDPRTEKPWTYLALLKGREGEFSALAKLQPGARGRTMPLILLRGGSKADDDPAQLADALDRMRRTMDREGPVLLDSAFLERPDSLAACLEAARNKLWLGVPSLRLTDIPRFESVVRDASGRGTGAALRITREDLAMPEELAAGLADGLTTLGLAPENVDLVLDLGAITWMHLGSLELAAVTALNALPWIGRWRHLAIAASGMPRDLREFEADDISAIPRPEIALYSALHRRRRTITRFPVYADYGVAHPSAVDDTADVRVLNMTASLRYSTPYEVLVVKGLPVRSGGYERFPDLLARLTKHPDYAGDAFSDGDGAIKRAAQGAGPGMGTKWREWATSHHLALVTRQIATQFAV